MRQFSLKTLLIAFTLAAISIAFCGSCVQAILNFDPFGSQEAINVDYDDFRVTPAFDPKGARRISYSYVNYRDGYDDYFKIELSPTDYQSLMAKFIENMQDPEYVAHAGLTASAIRAYSYSAAEFPAGWILPLQRGSPPKWWFASPGFPANCRCWDVRV